MKILVAGGAGFLGRHLCQALLDDGHSVIALDNLYTGRIENIHELSTRKNFHFIHHDVCEPISLEVDQIYNLACPASPIHYQRYPVQTIKTSLLGSINLLELARNSNARILQASTSEVYGDPMMEVQSEEYWGNVNPIGIRSCYDEGKRASESLFFDYHRQYGTQIKVARIFNTYGPSMDLSDGRVVSNFIVQALNNENITIYGDGTQSRSFCFVSDLISGLIKLMNSNEEITGPINLGNPTKLNMLELAESIIRITNSNSSLVFEPLPGDDPKQRKPNIEKAKKLLNWEPEVDLDEGLLKTINDFKSRI